MATSKAKKNDQLKALVEKFKSAEGVAFIKFDKATVMEVQDVRRSLRADGMTYTVIKKTLMAIAAKQTGLAEFDSNQLEGAVAVITSDSDQVAPAAAIKKAFNDNFDKETKTSKFDFAGAIFEGKFLDKKETAVLANTPSKLESYGRIVGMLKRGPQGIHAGLMHGLRGITFALKEADKFSKA